jgi:hypothetical protein
MQNKSHGTWGNNCLTQHEISKMPKISIKNGMKAKSQVSWSLHFNNVHVGRLMVASLIQSSDWDVTTDMLEGIL